MKKVLGIDLGGTSAKVGVVNQFGEIEKSLIIKNDSDNLLVNIYNQTLIALENWGYDYAIDIERIGFATPGFLDHEEGIVRISGNLGWRDFDLKSQLEAIFVTKPISVLNDANAAALGEFWTGAASTYNSEIFYTLGTGIGGAIVIDGKLISGENGFAGEFGHGGHMQTKFSCNCGLRYCLEPSASVVRIANEIEKEVKNNPRSSLTKYFKNIKEFNFKSISEAYIKAGKPVEIKDFLLDSWKPLFSHMSIMIGALNPKAIIIGGGASAMGQPLIEIFEEGLSPFILNIYKGKIRIEIAKLGNEAGIVGAAYYAINNWEY
ncbi:glucokinase [Williamsoniiplasma somnilux]|uniref:Glucokinase n=1 Tax=Williamsoniiplasma somnilux TaxID=215578 RepID=A0A2K8NYW2_9MOLU|nr:ROK family protein [Williamsoniiplasma somnilux]ATZ18746.1 glucokinase [Williamsoniiplasma somnilux]